ncbi:MAG TPA: PIG-L family deacetylase [Acidisarcina sp.]|nr:PIG-L family deacetylase [Acidisarcina sp.]
MIFRTNDGWGFAEIRSRFFGAQSGVQARKNNTKYGLVLATTACLILSQSSAAPFAAAQAVPYATTIRPATSQESVPEDRGAAGLWQTLRKLDTWASLMMITAHPDDEDGGMLTYESRGAGVRTSLLSLTRGEGGQNAMSGESYDALGLLRTQELLRADQFYGTEQMWTRVADFGFSKTADEASARWGRDRVLYDVVRAVRIQRPLVVTAVFIGGITDGHGQHQVSGEVAQEIFHAAGDPNVFPDQIQAGLRPWAPLKVYARVPTYSISAKGMYDYATGKWAAPRFYDYVDQKWSDQAPETNVEIAEGVYDPVLGRSYAQISRQGWGEQKSQNGGATTPLPGTVTVPYHLYGSYVPVLPKERSYFDGIDTSLVGIAMLAHGDRTAVETGLKEIRQHVNNAMLGYLPSSPEKIAPELHAGYLSTRKLMQQVSDSALSADDKANINHELGIKLVQFNTALAMTLGLDLRALVTPQKNVNPAAALPLAPEETIRAVTPGQDLRVRVHVSTGIGQARLVKVWLTSPEKETWNITRVGAPGLDDPSTTAGDTVFRVSVPLNAAATRPYFTRPNTEQPYYDLLDDRWLNESFAPYPLTGWAEFDYDGVPVRLGQVVQTVHRVHGTGAVYEPLMVTPEVSVMLDPPSAIVPLPGADFPVHVTLHSEADEPALGTLRLQLPEQWTATPDTAPFRLTTGEDQTVTFTVHPKGLAPQLYTIKAIARSGNYDYSEGFQKVGYTGLLPYNLYRPAIYAVRGVDVKVAPRLKVAYLMGTGDQVPQALANLGVEAHLLNTQELATADLSRYDTIVLGIRAYAAQPELPRWNRRLLDYVRNGGCLVVQYNSGEYDHGYGPYPYTLGRSPEKVVDEKAPVTLTDPGNPVLSTPNRITSADFDNWVEERGHSFMESWDPNFVAPTETHDEGQDPQKGGLLTAHYGKGVYIYVAFALYRQLPEGVPGAYRLLANLISAGKTAAPASANPPTESK